MRFVCDSCRAQYMISDDKVGPKGVKLRCKKCGHTILVRPAGATAAKEGGAEASASTENPGSTAEANAPRIVEPTGNGMPATLGTPPEGGLFTDVEEDEIGAVFDQVLSTGSQKLKAAEAEAEAKAAKAEAVRKLAEAEAAEPSPEEKAAATQHEWYVAIDEKQVGPWTVEKVKDAWDRGEVGPDNLCWRSGFSDWIPLSETAELASVLAPRPAKPVIVAPAPVSTSSPTLPAGPVESAFSAGSSRPGAGGNSAVAEEPVGWKPSAASVLASLVKEENDALSKPPPRPAPSLEREPLSQSRLLDVPMPPPEPVSSPAMPGAMMAAAPAMAAPTAYASPQPQGYAPQPQAPQQYAPQPPVAYAQPQAQMPYGQQPQGYPPPGYPAAYPPPAAAPAGGKGRSGVMMVAVTAGVLVMAGAAVVFVARGNSAERPAEPPAQVAAAPTPKAEVPPMPPPPAAVQTPPAAAAVQPAPTPPPPAGTPPEGTAATAAAGTPTAAGIPPAGTPPAAAPAVATAPAATPTPPPATAEVKPASVGTAVARVDSRNHRKSGSSGSRGSQRDDDEGDAITVSKPSSSSSSSSSSSGDDDFDELFGTKKAPAKPASKPTATAYIPPEPGGGTLERLQQSDIMQVVLNNKPAIVKCVNEQKQKDPSLSGKLVMRWTVQTSGKTSNVSCRTDEFRSSYMATCITGLIKSWSFPKHQKQGEPIDFPFTF